MRARIESAKAATLRFPHRLRTLRRDAAGEGLAIFSGESMFLKKLTNFFDQNMLHSLNLSDSFPIR
jgi:hypothetical protein